ncbi:MAG: hypothetical protein HYR55_09070 [Acidobacteria bacterium]|nr:hypothetical protein [Acidobacteriota bacterium]MBI3655158.1 hypothetical protein [Acidobacteriota bacterium]
MVKRLFVSLLVAALFIVPAFAAKGVRGKAGKANRALVGAAGGGGVNLPARDASAALTDEERTVVLDMVLKSSSLQSSLGSSRYRVFGVEATPVKNAGRLQRQAHSLLYDYTHNKTILVVNDITNGAPGTIIDTSVTDTQPAFTMEEYAEAKDLALKLDRVKKLMEQPTMRIQGGFSVEDGVPACAEQRHRCVQIQVNEQPNGMNGQFRLLVTVDLSARQVVEVREPKTPTTLAR